MKATSISIIIGATMVAFCAGKGAPPPAPAPPPPPKFFVPPISPNFVSGEIAFQTTTDTLNALSSVNTANSGGVLANSGSVFSSFVTDNAGSADNAINTVATGAAGVFAFP
jgi:hypothetical protein